MDGLRLQRDVMKKMVLKKITNIKQELIKVEPEKNFVQVQFKTLENLFTELQELEGRILDLMIDQNCTSEEYEMEREDIDAINVEWVTIGLDMDRIFNRNQSVTSHYDTASEGTATSTAKKRTFKLPKIEMKKFNGDMTDWLGWWSQYCKIHEDETIHTTDKFQYLFQAMVPGTRAMDLVASYPMTDENYPKVIRALKQRFAKKKLLKQVYVRELLKMVMINVTSKEEIQLSVMYDKLESHLRCLEELGVTSEQTAEFLYPMVESSLPEDILLAWQRSAMYGVDGSKLDPPKTEMDHLMSFLQNEVEIESQRKIVRAGFQSEEFSEKKPGKLRNRKSPGQTDEYTTAAGLFSSSSPVRCIFCDRNHLSGECFKAQGMSLEEKTTRVQEKKGCYVCLRTGHFSNNCRVKVQCILCNSRRHSVIMCPELSKSKPTPEVKQDSPAASSPDSSSSSSQMTNHQCSGDVLLQTTLVKVEDNFGNHHVVRLVFDSGSQGSTVRVDTARRLKLKNLGSVSLRTVLYGGHVTELKNRNKFCLKLLSLDGENSVNILAIDETVICGRLCHIPGGPWLKELAEKKIHLNDFHSSSPEIEILIGSDYYGQLITGRVTQLQCGLTAIETKFGWTLSGKVPRDQVSAAAMTLSTTLMTQQLCLSDLWSLEVLGIKDPAEVKSEEERQEATKLHFRQTVSRDVEGRYSVRLPWMEESLHIPDNKTVAAKRLISATSKLLRENKFEAYDVIFKQWEHEGIIEEVLEDSPEKSTTIHYLPHRPVFKPESLTTPVRPVFDASCKVGRNPSLNECLEKGPNLLELIPSILLRFREKRIGCISDIRKAFQMISVDAVDRDVLRFLWWEDSERKIMKTFRHKRVVFGVNCSPFLLGAVIEMHLMEADQKDQPVAMQLLKSLYVDNSVTSVDTLEDYEKFKSASINLMAGAKMELRQWERSSLKKDRVSQPQVKSIMTPVLGYLWDTEGDSIIVNIPEEEVSTKLTKRIVLSMVQKIFDPMGFLCPATLVPKLLVQEAWAEKTSWDEELDTDLSKRFQEWWSEVSELAKINIPRHAFPLIYKSVQVHTFSDACKLSYAGAVFIRMDDGVQVSVQLLQAKSRVAPVKKTTIPRLELLGCLISARLTKSVKKALGLEKVPTFLWTDSSTALAWIKRNDEWGTFVGNRVKEICQLTNPEEWSFVPGESNPADLPSRGCSPTSLLNSRWWEGPNWLKESRQDWPRHNQIEDEELILQEKKKGAIHVMNVLNVQTPWYLQRYSSYYKNIKLVAYFFRFVDKCKKKSKEGGLLTMEEIARAETFLVKTVQEECFGIRNQERVIYGLRVQTDLDGVIRVKTKLTYRQDSSFFKLPYLLPNSHPLVNMIVREEHILNHHCGVQFLVGHLRERFWIIHGRRVIKKVIADCVICKRYASKKPTVPQAPLPQGRVTTGRAFEVTGVDLAGPLHLKDGSKTWIVLFTCAVYRAVHLELVKSLSTDAFLLALFRFISRRGRPTTIHSDNGTNFAGTANIFSELDWKKITSETGVYRIQWKFNPPSAAWWGGWWERLVRSLKDLLKRMLGRSSLKYDELYTCICQAEAVLNDRPLTYVTEDQDDLVALKPSMFLQDIQGVEFPEMETVNDENLRARYRSLIKLKDQLRDRFRKEYLALLVQRGKCTMDRAFTVGEVVLIGDDNRKRLEWPMGRIIELCPGPDGEVRVARVKTAKGVLVRPLQRLYPLEVRTPLDPSDLVYINENKQIVEVPNMQQQTETSSPPNQECVDIRTRSGRSVKKPDRLGI